MRVLQVLFRADPDDEQGGRFGFKGVNAGFAWAPAVVLFGPNDVGKSNILEAVRTICNGNEPPEPRAYCVIRRPIDRRPSKSTTLPRGPATGYA